MSLLHLHGVRKQFGGLTAVHDLSFTVESGTIVAMIGPNGAGKSTVFNVITGIYAPSHGSVEFAGERIDRLKTYQIAARGIARTFQNIRLFAFMSAIDNIMTGEHSRMHAKIWDSLLHTPSQHREETEVKARAMALLEFVGLADECENYARNLPYGSQRKLEIARALAGEPKLLLLDEPAAGMNPSEKEDLVELICRIRGRGVTIFLIEHDMALVMKVSERITVLDHGEKISEGTPEHVRSDPRVIEAYLGKPA